MSGTVRARGGCHCGAVKFEVRGPLRDVLICHCEDCRKHNGHASAHTRCANEHLVFLSDAPLKWYDSSAGARRGFCSDCGSILFFQRKGGAFTAISAGVLEPPTGMRTAAHLFVPSKSDYYELGDDGTPRYDTMPGEADLAKFRFT